MIGHARSCLAAAALLSLSLGSAHPQTLEERRERGAAVIRSLNNGMTQPNLERMRQEFPFLADATEAYALGDVCSRPALDNRKRHPAAVPPFAALGLPDMSRVHAGYALNVGVSPEELKEVIYMVTVPAGFPRAIAASQALSQLFAEHADAGEKSGKEKPQ